MLKEEKAKKKGWKCYTHNNSKMYNSPPPKKNKKNKEKHDFADTMKQIQK